MKIILSLVVSVTLTALTFLSCKKKDIPADTNNNVAIIKASGNIQDKIDNFRQMLGPLNTTPGQVTGRREINWDAVPDSLLGKALPPDLFNPVSAAAPASLKRGLAYASGTGEFRVSDINFADIDAQAAPQFDAFSGNKTFANTSSNLWEVKFQVAGQSAEATVKGFGAVFSDVDRDNSTSLEFFNGNKSLGKYFAPPHDISSSFSFLGVYFQNEETITKILVSHQGNLSGGEADISNNGTADLIILDDFLYSEPVAK